MTLKILSTLAFDSGIETEYQTSFNKFGAAGSLLKEISTYQETFPSREVNIMSKEPSSSYREFRGSSFYSYDETSSFELLHQKEILAISQT